MEQDANENKKTLLALLILIVLLVLVSFGVWWLKKPSSNTIALTSQKIAPAGKLVDGISTDLILVNDAQVLRSHTLGLTQGATDKTLDAVYFGTDDSLNDLFSLYINYIQINSYKLKISTASTTNATLVADKDNKRLTIGLEDVRKDNLGFNSVVSITIEK